MAVYASAGDQRAAVVDLGSSMAADDMQVIWTTEPVRAWRGKRVFDVVVGSALILVLLPLLVVVAALVRATMGPGIIFRQRRVGRDGVTFDMLKFRTMDPCRRRSDGSFHGENRRQTHKSASDPRHTRLGRVLRKLSIDELPQLFNVVKGDMSLVGPRPELEAVVERYNLRNHPRHQVRPGLTGVWQVSRQRSSLLHENVHVDLDYLARMTLAHDLSLLVRTVPALLRPRTH